MSAEVATPDQPEVKFIGDADAYTPQPTPPAETSPEPDNQPQQPEPTPPVPAPEVKPAETPAPPAAPVIEPPAPPAAQPATQEPADEVDPLEKMGISKDDTYARQWLEAYKAGDHKTFERVMSTDWDKVPDLEVVRASIEQKYAALDPAKRDFMVKREMGKYNTESFDPDEKQAVDIALELEAKQIRDGFKAEQQQYKVPERQQDPEVAAIKQQMQQYQQEQERLNAKFDADPTIRQFVTDRLVKVGEGEETFSFEADPTIDIKDSLLNGYVGDFMKKNPDGTDVLDEAGKPQLDVAKWTAVRAAAKNWDKFCKSLIEHGKTLANRQRDAELRNLGTKQPDAAPSASGGVKFLGDAP